MEKKKSFYFKYKKMSENYFSSKNTKIWGPHYWYVFHNISLNYPISPTKETQRNLKNFIFSIPYFLPYPLCSGSIQLFLEKNNLNLDYAVRSKKDLVYFFFCLHNFVNRKIGKEEFSIDDFEKKYNFKISWF